MMDLFTSAATGESGLWWEERSVFNGRILIFLFKMADFIIKQADFIITMADFIIKQADRHAYGADPEESCCVGRGQFSMEKS